MAVHKTPKSESDLILDDKLDLARTLVRLKARKQVRRELNELESGLVDNHAQELQTGQVSEIDFDLKALFRHQLTEGDGPKAA